MKLRYPNYYRDFACVGSDCTNNCCHSWLVVLDSCTADFYRSAPGPLGEKLRAAMTEQDGEPCFSLKDGLCPMQTENGLCEIQLAYGPERLSRSCDQHPRFLEEYGALRECSLSMGCPEAARLLLAQTAPTQFLDEETEERVSGCNDLNAKLFFSLLAARKKAIALAQERALPWQTRRARLLAYAEALQRSLDRHRIGALAAVTTRKTVFTDRTDAFWTRLQALEPIDSRWPALLAGAAQTVWAADEEREQLTVYYLFRYLLKAVLDRQVLARVRLAVYSADAVGRLEQALQDANGTLSLGERADLISRYSREVEHSLDNMQALLHVLS